MIKRKVKKGKKGGDTKKKKGYRKGKNKKTVRTVPEGITNITVFTCIRARTS